MVALIDTNVSFTCLRENDDSNYINTTTVLIIDGRKVNFSMDEFDTEHDVEYFDDGYVVTIEAKMEYNRTRVQCFILPCFTEEATLIVVECEEMLLYKQMLIVSFFYFIPAPPEPVSPPAISIINDTSLLISWHPPWAHPVNMYYILVTDERNGTIVLVGNYTIEQNTYYLLTDTTGFECSILSVTIQAVTDVATTVPSNATRIPIYKGL